MSCQRLFLAFAIALCLAVMAPSVLFSQAANTGSVAGTVTDPQGAAVAAGTVTLTDMATNIARTVATNENGHYIFVDVPPGRYNLTITKTGFRNAKFVDQGVNVGLALTLNVKLEIGSVAETVEVTASTGAELQTLNATVGNTITGVALESLPSLGLDVSTFVTLQAGVSPDGSVAGAVVDQSSFLLDGGNNTNDMDGSMNVYTPSFAGDPTGMVGGGPTGVMPTPADSVEEFKVNVTNQTADFNSSAGAEVQVVTKRGTNAWHGTVYEYYLDNNFNANTWDNNVGEVVNGVYKPFPKPSYHYSRFGGSVGGPIIPKDILGGKTYFFANYQGFRWNNSATIERVVPTANMRNGILSFSGIPYNLKTGTNCGPTGNIACDPRGIGINPLVQQLWNKYEPLPNETGSAGGGCGGFAGSPRCDGVNEQGFRANILIPRNDNFGVARLDHDFGSRWHFNSSYRYYKLTRATTDQIDIGGYFPSHALGTPAPLSNRPQVPWYLVAGLTTNISPNTTNDFHFSYLRNYWAWATGGGAPQTAGLSLAAGLGGALEPFGESATAALIPYNVNAQQTRTRFWDGQDKFFRDDITILKGNHLYSFGGTYQRNWNYHQRTDNGGGINYYTTYQLGDSAGAGLVDLAAIKPAGISATTWGRDYAAVTGIVTDSQVAYTRSGPNLTLNPPLTPAYDRSTIPYYNVYFSDSWHTKPSLTLTYGLGWTLEMPPTEQNGKQVELVDASGQQLDVEAYLHQRKVAALTGQVYNPTVGFALVGNTGSGQKYPYNPFYGSFSPRVAVAWNPNFDRGILGKAVGQGKSVVRGGYSRIYGRLNGVDLVLVPLLGTGLIQPVQCRLALLTGVCGPTIPTAATAFRINVDGNVAPLPQATPTLPQPVFPGVNNVSAAAGSALDPHFRPNVVDSFDFTIQRQLTSKIILEVGYIGRRITHEFQPININAVPYMMTLGGQSFEQAYANVEKAMGCTISVDACNNATAATTIAALPAQQFFETALASTGYCNGFANCTDAVVTKQFSRFQNQLVWSLWSALDKGGMGGGPICNTPGGCTNANGTVVNQGQQTTTPGFTFSRSMLNSPIFTSGFGGNGQLSSGVAVNASVGHGNYNAGFVSLKMNNWHGLTLQQNLTYGKALGTGAVVQATSSFTPDDPFNLDLMYGRQGFDRKYVYNNFLVYEVPYYKSQQGVLGRLLGGWSFSPVFAAGSGLPLTCNTATDAQEFGAADGLNYANNNQCVFTKTYTGGSHAHNSVTGDKASGVGFQDCTQGPCWNMFSNPLAVWSTVRPPILGVDTKRDGEGIGAFSGMPYWNLDAAIKKDVRLAERYSLELQFNILNVLNHVQLGDPTLDISSPGGWGVLGGQANTPRQFQFAARFKF